ncbi:MAG: hypothetical protein HYX74_09535 [Acidobacteria bacterium]|nr:hypothetical protein [Acidobacteriota bacterium]
MSTRAAEISGLAAADASAIPFPGQHGMLVCLSGIDSAGKTQVAHGLEYAFKRQGIQVQYQWLCGGSSTFAEITIRLFQRVAFRQDSKSPLPRAQRASRKGLKFHLKKVCWYLLVAIDLAQFCIFKVRLPLLLGKVVICDGYTFDTFAQTASQYERDPSSPKMNSFEKFFHLLYPQPDLHYLLLGSPDEIEQPGRRSDLRSDEGFYARTRLYLDRYQAQAHFLVKKVEGNFSRVQQEIIRETVQRYWQMSQSGGNSS